MTAFREKSLYQHSQLAKKLDVAELMSRPAVIPLRRGHIFPEPDVRELVFGYRASGHRKLPPAESLGDAYAVRVAIQERAAARQASSRPTDAEGPGTAGKRAPGPGPALPSEGLLEQYSELIALILSGQATEVDRALWESGLSKYPGLQAVFDSARRKVKKALPWISEE